MKKTAITILIFALCFLPILGSCNSEPPSNGKSAYEIALENGFVGSEDDWLESLKGTDGTNGADGESGSSGKNGIGISSTKIDENGFLIVTLTDGSVINAGYVGVAKEDTSDLAPVLNTTSLNIPEGKPYLLTSDRPDTVFKSSDESIVQVSPEGLILALSEGNATITATARDGKETTCSVSVLCYDFVKLSDGTLEITGYYGTKKVLDIPSEIMGQAVTSIGNSAFADWEEKAGYKEVILPNSIATIGDYAFNSLAELTSVTFGNELKTIGNAAFSGCKKLNNINLPDSLEELGNSAFNACSSLTSIKIPNGIKTLNGSSFSDCENLTSVELGSGVTFIGMFAFGYCSKLQSIIIPENVVELDEYAFAYCTSLNEVRKPNAVLYYDNTFKNTPWFSEFGGTGENPAIIPYSSFEERNETVFVYATGSNDEHLPNIEVRAYIYPYATGWSEKTNEYTLANYIELKRVGIYLDDDGYGWSKLEFTASNGKITFIYVRNSQLVTELPNSIA